MRVIRIWIILLIVTTSAHQSFSQINPPTALQYKPIGWSITLPPGFEQVKSEDWAALQQRGSRAIEATFDTTLDEGGFPIPKNIFVFKQGALNYFEANTLSYSQEEQKDYVAQFNAVNELILTTFQTQMPDARFDTASGVELIDQLGFEKFMIAVTYPNGMILHAVRYTRLFGNDDLTVSIMYVDEKIGAELMGAWKKSTFKK